MKKKFNIVYITTNLINGKQYVGDHSTYNINDDYLGSGNIIVAAIKKYGKENFERKILQISETKEEAQLLQSKYINEYNTIQPNGYNISPSGGCHLSGIHSEESIKKISESHKGKPAWNKGKINCYSEETRKKWSKTRKGRPCSNKEFFCVKGRKFSPQHKQNMRKSKLGEKNPMFGKDAWKAINSIKKKCEYCGLETTPGNYGRWHGNRCKHKV